jgi:hypothetical protein
MPWNVSCNECWQTFCAMYAFSAYSRDISAASVLGADERSAGLAFARRMAVTYPLATDNAQVYASYGISGLPTTFFVSADGTIVGRQVGGMTETGLEAIVREVFGIAVRQP